MPKYRVNGDIYNIPEEKVSAFEKRYPNATVDIYDNDGAEYSLPVSEKVNFQKQFKNWSYSAPAVPSDPSAEKIDSVEQPGPVMPNPAMENRNWEVQMGNGHSRATVEKPEPVDVPIPQRPEGQEPSDDGTAAPSGDVRSYLENANRQQVANLSRDINSRLDEAQTKSRDIYMKEQEDARKGGFLSTLAHAIAASGHNPEGRSGGMSDAQQRTLQGANSELQSEISKLEAAKKAMSNAEEIIAEADKSVQEGKFPGFFKGVARGFGDKLFDVNTWDMGVSDTKNSIELLKALRKYDEGKPLSESEQMLLDAKSVELATNAYFGSYIGRGYKAGAVTAQSLPFMLEMAVNPASTLGESTQSMLARYALSRFAKKGATRAAQKFATKAAGAAGRALGDIAGSAVMAGTSGAVRVAGDAIDRHVGDIETDMDGQGQTVFAGHDPESLGKSIAKAFTSTAIENHSEMLGEYFAPALGIVSKLGRKGMEKFGLKNVVDFVDDVSATDAAKLIADFQKRTKWHGTIGEYAEEVAGNIENAILVGDNTLDSSDDTGVFNLDQNIDTFLGVALMGGVFSTIRTAAWRTPKYRARKEMEKARAKAKKKFGDQEWQDIEDRLAEAGDEGMSSVLSEVIIGERNPEREKAILDYAKSIKIYEGTLKGDEKHRELSSPEMTDLESSYENGYTLATPQEVHDAKIMFEYQQARLQQALGMSSIDIETLMLGNEMGKLTEEQKSVALDYLNAEATFDGVIDRVRDDIDNRISSVNAAIDASTNSDTGKLQPARLVDDRAVHIISGIVRLTPDGTMVDIHNSEDYIIIRDDKTGKIESVSPSQIVGVDAEIDPESEKKAAESQIRGQIGQQKADIIDGVLQFNPGDVYTLTNEQGQSFTVQIAADEQGIVDNGDGTINVILNEDIDANTGLPRISQMSKEQIENMAEATNMARLQQYEQQKSDVDARQYEEDSTGRTPENPFKINDRISFNDVGSGSVKHGIVESELTDDGKYEIAIENDGSIESVSYLSPEDLSNMQAQLVQSVEEQEAPEIEQNPAEIKQNPVEIEQPEQPQVSAFERIPKDEQGNPIYEQAETPELAWDAIVEQTDGDEAMAQTVTDGMVADKETALKKVEKAKSKGGATIAEKIAAEKERKAAIEEAKANLAVWKRIAQTARRRKDAEESEKRRIAEEQAAIRKAEEEKLRAEREEAERIKREALNGVPDISDDTPQDARARGYRRVSGHKVDRQEPIPHLQGNDIAVKFSDDVIVPGRVAVIEAETLQPSHIQGTRNPAHFIDESQPKERTDDASVLSARKIARNIRPEEITSSITAYTGAPTTNVRGEVIQGNNRSDALRLIWEGDKEQSAIYKQYLMDHAADFGLNADEISAMNHPVLVNMLDVDDAKAITLGQFVAQDTESGGTERIKPKNAVQKMGADMRTFADMLLASSDDETSFAGLVDRNGDEVLAWMNRRGFITPTQYKSAFDSKGSITAEAKNDLKGIMYQSIFTGGNIRLEEMFNAMPAKAQRAILATAFRDNESPNTERMVKEIQNSIRAYNALSQGEDFANAKNWKEARLAVESWKMQYAMDDVTGESYLPAEKFSNFALHLATMYKGESQSLIQSTFNHLYDLIQGTQEETLFEKPDNTPRTLAQAILETLNFEYDGQQRSNVLAGDSTASQEREQGSTGTPAAGERVEGGEQPADNTGGTENESGSGEVREKIAEEGSKVNTNPSDAQKEAGNYRMGHVKIDGMDVTIENPKGSIRKGRDADGKEWQSEMHNDYGYIRGTKAVDNDHIDIFLSDDPEHGNVYVIDQIDPKTGKFDESKVMYGFSSEQEARDAYLSNYEKGWKGLGKITEVTREEFKKWIDSSTRKTKPFSEYASVKAAKPQKEKPVQGIEGYSRDEIKGIVADHINDVMRDNDIHAEIIGMDIHGSRNRHDARPDSDLDVVVEYSGDIREDDMFNALNGEEDALSIEGIKVDINPIRKEETGDLQDYMKQSEEYDREKSEQAKQKGSSTTSEIKNNKSGKIEDYGEQISGARKDMLRDLAKSVQNTSLESLISLPFSKAFKKPNLRKAVEEGALRDKDARFAQAAIAAFLSTKKPVAGTKDERRRQRWGEKTNVEKWAEKAYTGIKILQELFDADERVRDKVIEAAVADKYVGVAEAKAQQQRIGGLNHREFNGTSYPLNLIALYNEVFDRLGYPAGQNTKIPVGRIVCSSTFDSYSLRGVNGEDWIYPSRSLKSFEDVVDELVYLIKVANADETADHPIENFKIRGINPKVETTGYRVLAAKNLTTAITRGNRFAVDEIFPTREAALKRIEELKATGLECSEPLEKRETVGYEKYQISFAHPITREFIPLEKEYGSKEDAIAAPEAEHEELNRLANEAIAAATKKSGESVEKSYFHITHYYDKGSDGKYHWYYGVALDDKYGPKKTAFNTMPFFLAERLNSREEAQKQIDANKERWESLVKDVVRQRSNFVYFSGDNETRNGEDYRNGKDVTAEEFANKFGFRGVQFGNWANQADRQAALNNAFDSFMDMSKIIGVSPKAMSLNGELGVAFGSRGSGAASAHYEPGEVVINLTKTRGAGSLAHEWWHALDNYFSRAANVKLGYVTSDKRLPMREEMRKAFNDLVDDVEKSDYHTRSMDKGSSYWGTREEETARLFAEWIADEMAKRGELNNFLAGRYDAEDSYARMGYVFYKAIQKLKPEGEMMTFEEFRKTPMALKGFSYPTRAELEILGKDVRNIFGEVQERTDETTGNVALFQMVDKILSDNSPENRLAYEAVSQMLSNAGIPVELLSDQAMREMAINATMLDTVLPEDESSFKGTVISSIDGAKILNNLDKAIDRYNENPDNRPWTFIGDLASALGSSDKDKSSQYATFETKNGQVVTIRVSNHNATVSNFDNAGESNGISIVISRKPNEGMTNDGDAHIVEFFYPDKALNKAEGKPLVEILKSIKQSLYSGEYKDTTGLAQREEVNAKESVEFLREPDGTVYGATVGGKIYLNQEHLNPNTPIHEYTHLWFSALKDANPELYKRGVALMKQLPIWEEVKTDPNYAELSGDDAIASECLSRLVGDRGADKLTELAKKAMVRGDIIGTANRISLIEDFKDWLKKFWTWVRDSFAPWTKEEASRVSVDDIQNMVLSDLAKGVNPLARQAESDPYIRFSIVKDPKLIEELDKGAKVKVYRAMQLIDGKLYPPMASKINGAFVRPIELGKWEQADEHPELIDKNGRFNLNKGNGKGLKAAYNPYIHTSRTPLNDQFSEAQSRPNIVTVEVEIPKSELSSGYKADKAKDSVGEMEWKAGIVQGQLTGKRKVILSRWDKPIRIVPDSEVANVIVNDMFKGRTITMPSNVVTPSLRAELEKLGVPFVQTDNTGHIVGGQYDGKYYSKVYGNGALAGNAKGKRMESETDRIVREAKENGTYMKAPNGKPTNLNERQWAQVRTRAFKKWFGDWEKAAEESPSTAKTNSSKIVDENGEPKVVYHGSPYRFFRFDKTKLGQSTGADSAKEGFFFTDNKELAELFSRYSLESLPVSDVEQLVKDRLLNMSENELNDAYEVYRNDSPDYLDYADETDSPNDRDYLEIRGFLLDGVSEEEAKREYIQDSIESKIEGGYFSDMEEVEEELSSIGIEFGNNEQVFLNIESPLVDEVERDYFHNGEDVSPMTPVLQNAKRMGSDGVVFTGIVESGQKGAANQYVAFEPNQIKSATDNVGTFDVGQEDIRYRDSGQMDAEYMSAIESGDMRKAGRMVEAAFRKAFPGSKVKNVVYHGVAVSEDGRQFPYNSIRDGHFTDDEGFAEYYAGADGYVYKVFLDIESPLEQDFRGQNSDFARDAEGNDVSTRTFARRARESNGKYDGAIISNVDEYGNGIVDDGTGNYEGTVTDYIPVRPEQVYSAEPVVYDDNGQVIPLSRRFENGNPDIRYKHDETGNGNRNSQDIEAAATKLAESLGEKVRLVRDVNEIENQNKKVQENQRKSKGWFNTGTGEIVVVLPNATGIEDVQATILHEAVGHKGLRELVGDDRFDDFLDKVYAAATKATRLEIVSLARRNHWDFRLATEEYIAGLAENGFAWRENRTLFEKIKDFFRDMLSRAKIALGVNIGDNELRYMLWRTYQMRTSRGILAKAEDISMQQSMKVGNFRNEVPEESSRLRFRNSSNGSRKSLARDIYEEKTRIVDRKGQKTDTANLMRRLKEAYVDSMQSLKYLQDAISEETGKPVEDFENAYLAENSMSSKNKAQTDIYLNRFFNPIKDAIRDLQKEGAEYGDIVRYLMAKHGLERNEVFSKRDAEKDGVVWDGSVRRDYSGLTELTRRETDTIAPRIDEITSRAEDIVRKFEMDHDTDVLWEKINDATKDTLRTSYITGILTKDNYEMVRSMFRYYIPLRGWSENTASAVYDYLSDARPKTSSIVKAATGRTTISDDPIATIAYMGQSAIIQGNRNMMKQKLLNLALNHKTGLLTVNRQWEVQDPVTGEWITRNPVIPVDATPEEVADIVSQFETDMKAAEKNGTARISRGKLDTGKHITAYEGQEHVVKVKRGGIEYCIYLNGNPRAAQAINGMTNPDAVDSWLIRKARVIKNFMARMFTSQNPAFIISNLSRDVIFAGTAVFAKEDSKYTALYTKNIAKALAKGQLIGLVHRFETGRLDDSKDIDRYFGEFIRNGGETGFTQLNTVDDFKRDLNRFAKEMTQGQVMKVSSKVWNGIWDGVEFMNRCAEDATRFSVYMTSRQMGRSVERSISDAKEITVNFNRKGSGGFGARVMNFAYIFFNAAIQALANAGKIFYEHPVKSAVALSTFSAAGFLAPLLAQAIISAFGGDDDAYWDLPEWVRRNNFVFYVPWSDNKFLIIPISQELRPFYALGEVAMSVLMGKEDVLEGLRSVGGSFMDLLPVDFMGNGNNLAVSLTPTVAQPFAQLVANSDYFGKPIYRRNDYNRLDPAWTKAYKGTSSMLINASKWLNEVTGGDDVKRGWIDPVNNPAVIEHLFESYLGGVGKTINKTAKTISMIWNPEMRDIRNVPIVSTFVQESDDERVSGSQLNREYGKAMEEFRETEHTISGYKRKARMGSMEYADKLSDFMNTPEFKKYSKMKGYASSIAKLRTALKKTEELNGDVMDAEYLQEMLRELKQQMLEELKED
nr:MAG TPA: Type I restriction enzyme [Caudoviricetes sp.]